MLGAVEIPPRIGIGCVMKPGRNPKLRPICNPPKYSGRPQLPVRVVLSPKPALAALTATPHVLCHAGFLVARLAQAADAKADLGRSALDPRHLDVAELFAFVCPAQSAVPTPKGLSRLLRLDVADKTDSHRTASGAAAIVPGQPAQSELYRRITLPTDDEEFMPTDGKPALSPAQVKLIAEWITAGAKP